MPRREGVRGGSESKEAAREGEVRTLPRARHHTWPGVAALEGGAVGEGSTMLDSLTPGSYCAHED